MSLTLSKSRTLHKGLQQNASILKGKKGAALSDWSIRYTECVVQYTLTATNNDTAFDSANMCNSTIIVT